MDEEAVMPEQEPQAGDVIEVYEPTYDVIDPDDPVLTPQDVTPWDAGAAWLRESDRIVLLDQGDNPIGELAPSEVSQRVRREKLNDEHTLTLETTRVLAVGTRVLTRDATGRWREHVVTEPDEGHERGDHATGTYECMWSIQHDLTQSYAEEHAEPGMGSSCGSLEAVLAAIDGQDKWTAGRCDVPDVDAGGGAVMIGVSSWDRLGLVVERWGGEVDAEISVDVDGRITREVCLLAHVGSTTVTRRFDWGRDLTSIHRMPDPGPYYCRVVPLGKGQREYAEDDETEFDWPSDVTEEPYSEGDGWVHDEHSALVRDPEAEEAFRTSDGHGGWQYPTKVVKYDEDDPELLLNAATEDLHNHTRPGVTYEADVLQFAEVGMDVRGVALGDDVHIVDRGFNPGSALRLEARVVEIEVDELSPQTGTRLTIGQAGPTLLDELSDLVASSSQPLTTRMDRIEGKGTIVYLENLIDQINEEANATGGYSYIVPGVGTRTYDAEVSDPARGDEASQCVEVSGGYVRIANSRNEAGDWEFRSLFDAGHVASDMVVAAKMVSGWLQSADGSFKIDLDGNRIEMNGSSMSDLLDDAKRYATDYITEIEPGKIALAAKVGGENIQNVMSASYQAYVVDGTEIARYGRDAVKNVWQLSIDNVSVRDMLMFGDFAWISRDNGNMTLKWIGA